MAHMVRRDRTERDRKARKVYKARTPDKPFVPRAGPSMFGH